MTEDERYIADWSRRLGHIESMVVKMHTDMYEGQGVMNPSIIQRLFRVEDNLRILASNSTWTFRLIVGTFIVGIIGAILHFVKI